MTHRPTIIRVRLLQPLQLGARLHPAGATVELGVDTAAHLLHLRRAVLATAGGTLV